MTPHTTHPRQTRTQEEPMSELLEQASPLPWHTRDRGIGFEVHSGDPADGCLSDEPKWCLSVNDGFRETMTKADAELIVRAVNAYEPLVKALRMFGDEYDIDGRPEWHSRNCTYRKLWAMGMDDEPECIAARAALATVESSPEREGGEPHEHRWVSDDGEPPVYCDFCGEIAR